MKVGCLGDIIFEVSDSLIKTIDKANWNGSANIHTHQVHLGTGLQEFVGVNPDEFSFTVLLSQYLGASPLEEIKKLKKYESKGETVQLILGNYRYGKYKWMVKNHKVKLERYDGKGNLTSCQVDISLVEYTKG